MYTLAGLIKALAPHIPIDIPDSPKFTGIHIDSRQVHQGGLFVALAGEQTDGHRYVAGAFAAGAAAALVSQCDDRWPCLDLVGEQRAEGIEMPLQIRVQDPLRSLQRLSHLWRMARPNLRVIGVTGSVGKTTTKEAIAGVLAQRYSTLYSYGNYNNEIGLPLTLLRLADQSHAVLEMGMYDLGEIEQLCQIARPQVGVVTNVGPTHLERLGSIERIAQAKSELIMALPDEGIAILNGDDPRVRAMTDKTNAHAITYGLKDGSDLVAKEIVDLGTEGIRFSAHICTDDLEAPEGMRRKDLRVGMVGQHAIWPALCAVAVGVIEGLSWSEIETGLANSGYGIRMVPKRGIHQTTLIDDTYNSSPASALAALDVLCNMPGRHMAILGDMLELGSYEQEGHVTVGRRCAETTDRLITVGKRANWIAQGAIEAGMCTGCVASVQSTGVAAALAREWMQDGDAILVKGSRGIAMETIIESLEEQTADD